MRTSMSYVLSFLTAIAVLASPSRTAAAAAGLPGLGPNVLVFDPNMPTSQIQAAVDGIANQQVNNEMGTQRYALLFKPGIYGSVATPLTFQVGYYTEVAGLGASPTDVVINGHVDVYNRCLNADGSNCLALDNFWRSISNLTINVTGLSGCRASGNFWAVSQAAPMRRVNITGGNLTLLDYCTAGPQEASGGFIADSQTGYIINGSQQQFLVRDSSIGGWSNGVWNQVFSGVVGAPAQSFPTPPYTTLPASTVSREKPFLYVDADGSSKVFVPDIRTNASGPSWTNGATAGASLALAKFFIATPAHSAREINTALDLGLNLLLTPGIYHLNKSLQVRRRGAVVLGLGFPTLTPDNGTAALTIADTPSVKIAGLLIDAGPVNSAALLKVGVPDDVTDRMHDDRLQDYGLQNVRSGDDRHRRSNPADPTTLQDVFFRIGGAQAGKATVSLLVKSDNVLLDDIWAWRADHGNPGTVGWTVNTADTGLVITGDNITAYGLFVEHYQKYQVIWTGENGRTVMFQNEMPYDPPTQAAWSHDGINGYAAYKVADRVGTHTAYGLGSYCFFNVNPSIHAAHGFEVPPSPGIQLHDILTISLGYVGIIDNVVNATGGPTPANTVPVNLLSYP